MFYAVGQDIYSSVTASVAIYEGGGIKCPFCGSDINDNSQFCSNCGGERNI